MRHNSRAFDFAQPVETAAVGWLEHSVVIVLLVCFVAAACAFPYL
jgi:hypothetical protein